MTLEQIENLKTTDIIAALQGRLAERDGIKSPDTLIYTIPELDAELILYKAELTATENERLRRVDLENRFETLNDMRKAFNASINEPNPALWLKELMLAAPKAAEAKLKALEELDEQQQNSPEKKAADFEDARIKAYIEEGATVNLILEAIWEKIMEARPEKADALQVKRERVKERFKK